MRVPPEGFEPPLTGSKPVVISISLRRHIRRIGNSDALSVKLRAHLIYSTADLVYNKHHENQSVYT